MTSTKLTTTSSYTLHAQSIENASKSATITQSGYKPPSHGIFPLLPASWVPYAELMRLDRLSGFWAFFWHYLIGLAFAANLRLAPADRDPFGGGTLSPAQPSEIPSPSNIQAYSVLRSTSTSSALSLLLCAFYLSVYTTIFRGIACTWNDNLDQSFDRQVARTRYRPIARGAVSTAQGHVFTIFLIGTGATILSPMPRSVLFHALLDGVLLFVYPLLKRWTDFPQVELGFGLAYPVWMVPAMLGVDPLAQLSKLGVSWAGLRQSSMFCSAACLYGAGVLWTVIFDTVYAYQDYNDDRKAGVRGLAVRLGRKGAKPALAGLAVGQVVLLIACGEFAGFGTVYRIVTCGGVGMSLVAMLYKVQLDKGESCAWWFGPGSRPVGFLTVAGLLGEYAVKVYALSYR